MSNQEKHITQEITYGSVWNYRELPLLTLGVCLSELIDNSIASFQLNIDKLRYINTLNIEITSLQKQDGSRQIIVTDNAFGMDSKELEDSIKINKDIEIKTSRGMNQYGLGLKNAIFWIGDNAEIITKQNNETYKLVFEPINKNERKASDVFSCKLDQINDDPDIENNGTKIIIDCLRGKTSRYWGLQTEIRFKELKEFLGKKYKNYLSGNNIDWKLNLVLKHHNENEPSYNYEDEVQPIEFNNNPLTVKKFYKNIDDLTLIAKDIEEKYSDLLVKKDEISLFSNLYNKLIKNEPIKWTEKIDLSYDVGVKINFSLLSNASSADSGLIISHNNRYINFPTKPKANVSNKFEYYGSNSRFVNHYDNWLSMELKLEDIDGNEECKYIKPDHNKVRILFSDNEPYTEEIFKNKITHYIRSELFDFLKLIVKINQHHGKKVDISSEIKDSYNNKESFASQTTTLDEKNDCLQWKFKENKYVFNIKFINDENNEEIFISENLWDEDDFNKVISINKGSKLIKNNDNNSWALLLLYIYLSNEQRNSNCELINEEDNINNLLKKISSWKK